MKGPRQARESHGVAKQERPIHSRGCSLKRQLLEDYVERVQALAVESELLLIFDEDSEGNLVERWQRIEQVRITCEIARVALVNHTDEHGC